MFDIRLADNVIRIDNLFSYSEDYCRDYVIGQGSPDLLIDISREDIEYEKNKSEHEDIVEGRQIRRFDEEYLEILAIYRKIAEQMPYRNTFLFHGSAIAVDGEGYLFTAKSGTGKSTHARLWRDLLGDRVAYVNDDKPLIRTDKTRTTVYGTPWDGKHRLSSNISVPLKSICILERGTENTIRRITKEEAYPMLLQQVYRPSDPEAMAKTLKLIDLMDIKFYKLSCNMDISAAKLSYGVMSKQGD